MDVERFAERLITEALERGELDTSEGVGGPLRGLDADPDWWVKGLLEREALPDRFSDVDATYRALVDRAVAADRLSDARAILASANELAARWNHDAPGSHRLPAERSEVWLLDRRGGRPAG